MPLTDAKLLVLKTLRHVVGVIYCTVVHINNMCYNSATECSEQDGPECPQSLLMYIHTAYIRMHGECTIFKVHALLVGSLVLPVGD
jgi:hypothetical protein